LTCSALLSADRAGIFDSMVQVPIPDQDGQEGILEAQLATKLHSTKTTTHLIFAKKLPVNCMLDYSIWPGSDRWRAESTDKPRPYQDVVQELFSCPVREACADLGLHKSHFLNVPLLFGITQGRQNRIMSAVFYLATNLTSGVCVLCFNFVCVCVCVRVCVCA